MLTYHPAFDIYHCAFRILLLSYRCQLSKGEIERVRIWDFYLVFPKEARKISFPVDLWSLKSELPDVGSPYEDITNPQIIFERMKPFQLSAIKYLSAYGFINNEQLSEGIFQRTKKKLPVALKAKMDNLDVSSEYICRLVSSPLNSIPLLGERGLKYRTKLLDFNHDPI